MKEKTEYTVVGRREKERQAEETLKRWDPKKIQESDTVQISGHSGLAQS